MPFAVCLIVSHPTRVHARSAAIRIDLLPIAHVPAAYPNALPQRAAIMNSKDAACQRGGMRWATATQIPMWKLAYRASSVRSEVRIGAATSQAVPKRVPQVPARPLRPRDPRMHYTSACPRRLPTTSERPTCCARIPRRLITMLPVGGHSPDISKRPDRTATWQSRTPLRSTAGCLRGRSGRRRAGWGDRPWLRR
jgi:hypothetical protein